jgi:hypothetical protein
MEDMEFLKAMLAKMNASMKTKQERLEAKINANRNADQEKVDANREHVQEMIRTNPERMEVKMKEIIEIQIGSLVSRMEADRRAF